MAFAFVTCVSLYVAFHCVLLGAFAVEVRGTAARTNVWIPTSARGPFGTTSVAFDKPDRRVAFRTLADALGIGFKPNGTLRTITNESHYVRKRGMGIYTLTICKYIC